MGTAARLSEIHAELERLAPGVNRWLCISPDTRGPMPDTRGAVRVRVEDLLEEMADLVADD